MQQMNGNYMNRTSMREWQSQSCNAHRMQCAPEQPHYRSALEVMNLGERQAQNVYVDYGLYAQTQPCPWSSNYAAIPFQPIPMTPQYVPHPNYVASNMQYLQAQPIPTNNCQQWNYLNQRENVTHPLLGMEQTIQAEDQVNEQGHERSGRKVRAPRKVYTKEQVDVLNDAFASKQYIDAEARARLADFIGVSQIQVKIWFQNKRSAMKKQKNQQH